MKRLVAGILATLMGCAGVARGADPVTEAQYYAAHRYDPNQSSMINWGTAYVDQVLEYGQIRVVSAVSLAGGISSIKIAGREVVASGGHGAAVGVCTHPLPTECYNPTENGNKADDRRDKMGVPAWPPWNAPLPLVQHHGPSTSAIWSDATYWKTSTLPNGQRRLRTYNRMTYYVPGWGGYTGWGDCVPNLYPDTPAAALNLSAHVLDKEVRLGSWRTASGESIAQGEPFIGFRLRLIVEPDEPVRPLFDLVMIAYLLKEFSTIENHIASTPDGYAYGWAVEQQVGGGPPTYGSPLLWDKVWAPEDPLTVDRVTTTQATWYSKNTGPGVIEFRAYTAVGCLPCVQHVLGLIRGGAIPLWE